MEATLATFLTPEKPVPKQIHSAHKEGVFNIARRCFFLLLRCGIYCGRVYFRKLDKGGRTTHKTNLEGGGAT